MNKLSRRHSNIIMKQNVLVHQNKTKTI